MTGQPPEFEIDSSADASRVSVKISFVDDAGRAAWSPRSRLWTASDDPESA
jgi:hypothetical protein